MSRELCDIFENKLFPVTSDNKGSVRHTHTRSGNAHACATSGRGSGPDSEHPSTHGRDSSSSSIERTAALFEAATLKLMKPEAVNRVILMGSENSYISSPPIHHGFPKVYVVCMWVRLNSTQNTNNINLFRVRSSNLCSTECSLRLSEANSDTHSRFNLRAKLNHRDPVSVGGRVNLETDMCWHLVTVMHKYCSFPFSGTATVLIDGDIAMEQDLDYPFKPLNALTDTSIVFEFGEGLFGSLGCISVFDCELSVEAVRCLHDAGPGFISWAGTALCPQYTSETGHTHLSLNYDRLVRSGTMKAPLCYLTARHFNSEEWLPCIVPSGRATVGDEVELEARISGSDMLVSPRIVGSCTPRYEPTQQRLWEDVGGPSIVLFMLQQCIKEMNELSASNASACCPEVRVKGQDALERVVLSAIRLVAALIRESLLMREMFLQEHGFHVLALCLRKLVNTPCMMNITLVDECVALARGLKTDLIVGDVAAAALQGLLFDFGIWKHAGMANKIHLFDSIATLAPTLGTCLKQYIGLQRVLDLAREHMLTPASRADYTRARTDITAVDREQEQAEIAVVRLVILVLKAAQQEYDSLTLSPLSHTVSHDKMIGKSSERQFAEIGMIFVCLEETTNTRFAESLIHHAIQLLYECPRAFTQTLASTRFYDVTAVKLLTTSTYSSEMRRSALHLFMWGLIQAYPDLIRDILYWLKKFSRGADGDEVWYQHDAQNILTQPSQLEKRRVRRPMELLAVLKTKKATLSKMWNLVCMVSASADRAMGSWADTDARTESSNVSKSNMMSTSMYAGPADNVLSVLCHDGPLGRLDCWLSLPWLAALLPHAGLEMCQKALMAFSMSLKIHEHEISALSVLPDCRWVYHLLVIAAAMHTHLHNEEAATVEYMPAVQEQEGHDTCAVETYASVAQACLDVALDSLAQVIVYQTIHFGEAGRLSWQQLVCYLQLESMREHEINYLRQCVLYIFQKISRNHCGYNRYVLFALTRIVFLVEEKKLCGNTLERKSVGLGLGTYRAEDLRSTAESVESADSPRDPPQIILSPVENKLLMFTIELSHKIRQGCEGSSLGNGSPEIKIILLLLRIFTGCLSRLTSDGADAVCAEIEAIVVHSIDGWLLYGADYYRVFVLGLFDSFYVACRDSSVPSACREKYKQTVVSILHFYMAIRRIPLDDMQKHYHHVLGAVGMLRAADDCYDANAIFALLNDNLAATSNPSPPSSRTDSSSIPDSNTATTGTTIGAVATMTVSDEDDEWVPAISADVNINKNGGDDEDVLFATELSSVEDEHSVHCEGEERSSTGPGSSGVHAYMMEGDGLATCTPESLDAVRRNINIRERRGSRGSDGEVGEQPFYFDLVSLAYTADTDAEAAVVTSTRGDGGGIVRTGELQRNKSKAESVDDLLNDYDECGSVSGRGESSVSDGKPTLARAESPGAARTIVPRSDTRSPSFTHPTALSPILAEQESRYVRWRCVSAGILADRLDTERARMERFHMSMEMTALATKEHWLKASRKIDTESFGHSSKEMWELAMRFEGQFPGRRRIVLLPWFLGELEADHIDAVKGADVAVVSKVSSEDGDVLNSNDIILDSIIATTAKGKINDSNDTTAVNGGDSVKDQLRGAYVGHDNFLVGRVMSHESDSENDSPDLAQSSHSSSSSQHKQQHGHSWSIVDMDDGEVGGYGVVGLARIESDNSTDLSIADSNIVSNDMDLVTHTSGSGDGVVDADPSTGLASDPAYIDPVVSAAAETAALSRDNQDSLLDLAVMAEGLQQGRDVETAPCFSGTKKLTRDAHVAEVSDVSLLTAVGNFIGTISFTTKEIFFSTASDASASQHLRDDAAITLEAAQKKVRRRRWHIDAITGIFMRSYRLRQSGMEVIFSTGKYRTFFIDFGSSKCDVTRRNCFAASLFRVAPKHAIKQHPDTSFHRLVSTHGIQDEWVNGRVSNYDYLMYINTMAGRSFNDLCQYPVMPWIIAQYDKDTIDLTDPATYRDLSKPMGAQTEARLERIRGRYEALAETDDFLPPFMYGSHYSTMVGVVLYYLLRLQPYAELHKVVQGGNFDHANRLFSSVKKTWTHNSETTFEVKELTPEWFTLPDFLRNTNNFDFGRSDESEVDLGDVELPNWASTPEDFIRINREALESDYVSAHLHEWIDLIFGYKQRGAAAVDANNLFYYLTYSGAIDRDKLDAATLEGVDAQIAHFGQCPSLVFDSPHPAKLLSRRMCVPRPMKHSFSTHSGSLGLAFPVDEEEALIYNACATAIVDVDSAAGTSSTPAVIAMKICGSKIICIRDNGSVNVYRHMVSPEAHAAIKAFSSHSSDAASGSGSNSPNVTAGQLDNATSHAHTTGTWSPQDRLLGLRTDSGVVVGVMLENRVGIVKSVSDFLGRSSHNDGTALHRLPVQRMKNRYEGASLPGASSSSRSGGSGSPAMAVTSNRVTLQQKGEGIMSMEDLAVRDSCRNHFVGRQDDVILLSAGRPDGLIYVHGLEPARGDATGAAYFSGHLSTVTCLAHDQKRMDHNQSIVCSVDRDGVTMVWAVTKKATFMNKSYSVSRHPIRLFRAFSSPFNCCDISLELGIVAVGSQNFISIFSIEYNMKLRDIDITVDICNAQVANVPGMEVKCYIQHVSVSNYGSITLFVEKEVVSVADGTVHQTTHILASYSVNGSLAVLIEVPWTITCMYCPKKDALLMAGCSDGSILFLLCGSLEIIHNTKPSENCRNYKLKVSGTTSARSYTSTGDEGQVSDEYALPSEDSAITCIRSGPSPEYPSLVVASNSSGDIFLIPLPDYIRWDKIESGKTIISNIVESPMSAIRGTLKHAQSITGHAAGTLSRRLTGGTVVGGAQRMFSRFTSSLRGGGRGAGHDATGDVSVEETTPAENGEAGMATE